MANFEAFRRVISSSINLSFLKSAYGGLIVTFKKMYTYMQLFFCNFRSKSCKRDLWNKIEQSEKQEMARANSQTEMKTSFKF